MSFSVEPRVGHRRQPRSSATPSSAVAGVEDAVKGGRSPAKDTLEGVRKANTLQGLGLVAVFRGPLPSPSGGCIQGAPVARPGPEPRLPVRVYSRGSWRAIWFGWPACSPPCTPRPRNNADAVRYACPAQTPDRSSRMGPASLCPSRVASRLMTGRATTTRSGKKTEEDPNSEERPNQYQVLEEHPASRQRTATSFRLAATPRKYIFFNSPTNSSAAHDSLRKYRSRLK
jgi:hypothetical protein